MRNILLGLTPILLTACTHDIARHDDLSLDQFTEVDYPIYHPEGRELKGGRVTLTRQPDLMQMAHALGVTRGTMVEWGMQCRVDAQWHLADCQIAGITPEFADKQARVASFLNGLPISRIDADITPDRLRFLGRFHLRNAVPAPEWNAPCHSQIFCPVIHTLERNPPPPPPPPPSTPPQ